MSTIFGQAKRPSRLHRRSRNIAEFTRVLIVCEGASTEPNYFRELCREIGLAASVVEVVGEECDSAPISVYNYATNQLKEDGSFDEIYCVFDRDTHETFDTALHSIRSHPSKKLRSIVSYPCFEYWVLLHFNYTRASLPSVGKRSCGKRMLDLLLTEWPGYKKGAKNVYLELARQDLTDIAIDRAARARADADATGDPDPSTEIDRLVLRLRQLSTEFLAISR